MFMRALPRRRDLPTYFVDATNGSDSNSGKTPALAWKTITKIETSAGSIKPNDRIAFKRGERWRDRLDVAFSGTAGNPVYLSAYGSGADPIIDGTVLVTGWTNEGSNVWSAPQAVTSCSQVFFNNTKGTNAGSIPAIDAEYEWYWASSVLYVYSTADPDTVWFSPGVGASVWSANIIITSYDYVRMEDIQGIRAKGAGFDFRDADGIEAVDCNIAEAFSNGISFGATTACNNGRVLRGSSHNNGTGAVGGGCIISNSSANCIIDGLVSYSNIEDGVACGSGAGNGNIIKNCTLYSNYEDGIDIKSGSQTIEYNYIHDNADYGINVHITAGTATVTGNNVVDNGGYANLACYTSGKVISYGNYYGYTAQPSLTTANVYVGSSGGADSTFHYDIFDGSDTYVLHLLSAGIELYNCNFYNQWDGGSYLVRLDTGANNTDIKNCIFNATGVWVFFINTGITGTVSDYNQFYRSDQSTSWINITGTDYDQSDIPAVVYAAKGIEQNSKAGNPLWTNPGSDDFTLQSGSPCRNSGTDVSLTIDYYGVSVPQETNPAIGAAEYVA